MRFECSAPETLKQHSCCELPGKEKCHVCKCNSGSVNYPYANVRHHDQTFGINVGAGIFVDNLITPAVKPWRMKIPYI